MPGTIWPAVVAHSRATIDTRNWIRDHADAYRGQWVAVCEGALLGAAPSLKGLLAALGPNYEQANTIVTRVL